jgi:hypothetical protein
MVAVTLCVKAIIALITGPLVQGEPSTKTSVSISSKKYAATTMITVATIKCGALRFNHAVRELCEVNSHRLNPNKKNQNYYSLP